VSQASDARDLPRPNDSVDVQKHKFAVKGLNELDLVTLVGKYLNLHDNISDHVTLHFYIKVPLFYLMCNCCF
jgi:hypothetical protein